MLLDNGEQLEPVFLTPEQIREQVRETGDELRRCRADPDFVGNHVRATELEDRLRLLFQIQALQYRETLAQVQGLMVDDQPQLPRLTLKTHGDGLPKEREEERRVELRVQHLRLTLSIGDFQQLLAQQVPDGVPVDIDWEPVVVEFEPPKGAA